MHQTVFTQGKLRKFGFLKIQSQNAVGELSRNAVKTTFLDSKVWLQRPLEFFLRIVRPCWRYLKVCLTLLFTSVKKNQNRATHQTVFTQGKLRKVGFLKIQSQNGVGELSRNAAKTSFLDSRFWLQMPLEFFSTHRATILKVSQRSV